MKAVLDYLGFKDKPLPKMTAFMEANDKALNAKEHEGNVVEHYYYNINYGKFIAQQLEKWMFVATDKKGNVLEKPEEKMYYKPKDSTQNWGDYLYGKYKTALDRVIFEGWSVCDNPIWITDGLGYSICTKGEFRIVRHDREMEGIETIENYIDSGGELTLKKRKP